MNRRMFAWAMLIGLGVWTMVQLGAAAQPGGGGKGPTIISPQVGPDRKVTFRLLAPKAGAVRLQSSDMPGDAKARSFTKGDNGAWELTLGPVDPGSYRYN